MVIHKSKEQTMRIGAIVTEMDMSVVGEWE